MDYSTKSRRIQNGIDLELPINYRHIWDDLMPQIKIWLITMSIQQVADKLGSTVSRLSQAMSVRGISANRVRYENKLKLVNHNC